MTEQDHHEDQGGVRERLGGVVHAVQEAVADRVAPARDAVTAVLHEAGQAATHLGGRRHTPEPETGPTVAPSGTRIVRPTKGGSTFLAWRDGHWTPVHRVHGAGWVWDA